MTREEQEYADAEKEWDEVEAQIEEQERKDKIGKYLENEIVSYYFTYYSVCISIIFIVLVAPDHSIFFIILIVIIVILIASPTTWIETTSHSIAPGSQSFAIAHNTLPCGRL